MRIAVTAETAPGERRVAATPSTVRLLTDAGWSVVVERGAGRGSFLTDDAYAAAGAELADDVATALVGTDAVLAVQPLPLRVLTAVPPGAAVVSLLMPNAFPEHVRRCRDRRLTAFALELVPRTSRAQPMDALTSQATVAGYRAVVEAAARFPGLLPGAVTAAGTVPPAAVLVLGVGVAGLSAIATGRRLGAAVSAHDLRPESPDEVASLGADFLSLGPEDRRIDGGYARVDDEAVLAGQRSLLAEQLDRFDIVVMTAAVPGRVAPLLLTTAMVERMRPGSVVVDLAAEAGGNCELTRPGEHVEHTGVAVIGLTGAASGVPRHASELLARNVAHLVLLMTRDRAFAPDSSDEVVAGCCLTRDGVLVHPLAREALGEAVPVEVVDGTAVVEPAAAVDAPRGSVAGVAALLGRSRRVVLVPGYGLARAQAQHALRELVVLLRTRGVTVACAVHPVAGRMPGQLNMLLDRADVPRDLLLSVDEANEEFGRTDLVLVVGANDIVNPRASAGGSALSGLAVLDVGAAGQVVVCTRSGGRGFADVDNPLFRDPRTILLLGDAEETLRGLAAAVRP